MDRRAPIERLLRPRSVAVVGASATRKALANSVLDNLARAKFAGAVHVVHPTASEIEGRKAVSSLAELPENVDCVVLAIPAAAVLQAVRDCAARKVGGVIVFSAGFAELGEEGRAVQDEIRSIARDANMAVEGPNCLGMMNFVDGIPLTFSATDLVPVTAPGIGIVSQSGAMAVVVRGAFHGRNLAVSYVISTGNEAANGIEDFLEFLLDDASTRVIAMIGEQLRDARRFLELAGRAREIGKPIILLHPGKSVAAREAAKTHTGAMAGDNEVMRAMARGKGVTVVDTLEQLIDVAEFVQRFGFPSGAGLSVIGESGALSAHLLDYCEEQGVPLPSPEGVVAERLAAMAPGFIQPANPLDLTAQAMTNPDIYRQSLDAIGADEQVGVAMLAISLTSRAMAERKMPPLIDILRRHERSKPIIFSMVGDDADIGSDYIAELRSLGIPFYRSPERAVRAISVLLAAEPLRDERALPSPAPDFGVRQGMLSEAESKELLRGAGLPVPEFRIAQTADEGVLAAEALGYPVVIKVHSAHLPHKSDVGGVVLGLADEAALRAGWQRMMDDLARNAPDAPVEGVLVERMARKGVELIVGARNDPQWGPVVLVGLGGVYTELFKDLKLLPATSTKAQVIEALDRLKGAQLLQGYRGSAVCDLEAVAQTVCGLGDFVARYPRVAEVEINPLLVYGAGEGTRALDALVRVE